MMETESENPAVTRFRDYLRIKSVHPTPDYAGCIAWIKKQAIELNLEFNIIEFPKPAEFAVWLTWPGKNGNLKSILLNSHIDVVPVEESQWTYDPFGADKDADGNIFARGTQDMKSVGVQYLESIRRLKEKGFVPLRNVHISFVPDEEKGGTKGMAVFVNTKEFANLNIGFAMDEGITSPDDSFFLSYTERSICQIKVTAQGDTGHSLIIHENTAAEKINQVINELLLVRKEQKKILEKNPELGLGNVTTINLTKMEGGLQINIVPSELSVYFDIRVSPNWKKSDVVEMLDRIVKEAGPDVRYEFILNTMDYVAVTPVDQSNVWWKTFKTTCNDLGLKVNPVVFPGCTDVRFVRKLGIPSFGFSPINNTPVRLHANDEYLNESTFLRGIEIYEMLIWNLANQSRN